MESASYTRPRCDVRGAVCSAPVGSVLHFARCPRRALLNSMPLRNVRTVALSCRGATISFSPACWRAIGDVEVNEEERRPYARARVRCVGRMRCNQSTASGFRRTPEQRETNRQGLAFCLSRGNMLSCKVPLVPNSSARQHAAFDDFPHSIDYHGPVGLSPTSRAGPVNQPVAELSRRP